MLENNPFYTLDPEIFTAIAAESERQQTHLQLIASENYTSKAVMAAQGSVLTNKYAEGYPHKRYYGGCEHVDVIESLAISRVKTLYNAAYANVQPHSGSQANAAVYLALLNPGDTVLGMSLAHGGHLTHGSSVNFSGKIYKALSYGVNPKTGWVDYEEVAHMAKMHRPKMLIAGFSAYSRILDFEKFRAIADEVGAYLLVDMAHVAGLVAAGLYPNPVAIADVVTSTTHKTLRGPRGGIILSRDLALGKKFDSAIFPGLQGGPLMHVIAAKAIAFKEALDPKFSIYQRQVIDNAKTLANALQQLGYTVISGGTDNHLLLVDLQNKNITGKAAETLLDQAGITLNKNSIPNDPKSPFVTSGIRMGTPAITTRGLKETQCEQIARWIAQVLENPNTAPSEICLKVRSLCEQFPLYANT